MTEAKKKTTTKKASVNKVARKDRPKREVKGATYVKDFMIVLIQAGHLPKIADDNKERKHAAMKLRQMAVTLARQVSNIAGDVLEGE